MHNFDIKKQTIRLNDLELTLETGRMAKQANGSVFITYGETSILHQVHRLFVHLDLYQV